MGRRKKADQKWLGTQQLKERERDRTGGRAPVNVGLLSRSGEQKEKIGRSCALSLRKKSYVHQWCRQQYHLDTGKAQYFSTGVYQTQVYLNRKKVPLCMLREMPLQQKEPKLLTGTYDFSWKGSFMPLALGELSIWSLPYCSPLCPSSTRGLAETTPDKPFLPEI